MKRKRSILTKSGVPKSDMLETHNVSPWHMGKIIPTSNQFKKDTFESFRPTKPCVDYKISETWVKMQKGDLKVNVKETVATYTEIPPDLCKPEKKQKLFSGGPAQWKFVDEIWRENIEESAVKSLAKRKEIIRQTNATKKSRNKNVHAVVQELVGPEWFMELSPKQLAAIDDLSTAVFLDRRNETTICCEEILARLGLVLRPSKKHIKTALQHSCGCPVEFVLVIYQLMNPQRENYSLNDRLLLSSVVHLTIRSTLRELHIRMPSPPEAPEEPKVSPKKWKKKEYASPYLQPLTFHPKPPKFSGIYKNKHKQFPESVYFSYLDQLKLDKKNNHTLQCPVPRDNQDPFQKEYSQAQNFYETLPGVEEQMLQLIPPSILTLCPNMLNPTEEPPIDPQYIAPNLCKLTESELVVCFCKENCLRGTGNSLSKKVKRSRCEKHAQDFLGSICFCDDCIENIKQKNIIRIHGGVLKSPCSCCDPIPIIQGTLPNQFCNCFKEYRNKIVGCATRQRMMDSELKCILGEVVMTKFGPVYNIIGVRGPKICLCHEIIKRKAQVKKCKSVLLNNETKFVIGGIHLTKDGPVFNLMSVVARKPCKCILKYWKQLAVLNTQNVLREHPVCFVNNGLVDSKFGPLFYLSCVPDNDYARKNWELRKVCSCEIKKTKCFEHCLNYLEYKVTSHTPESSLGTMGESSSTDESSSDETDDGESEVCPYCLERLKCCDQEKPQKQKTEPLRSCQEFPCQKSTTEEPTDDSETSNNESRIQNKKSSSEGDFDKPKPCTCKDELERFIKSKCPCEECNRIIRQKHARYIMGGTKTTQSGNQVNIIQGIQQPLCSCMHEHLENITKIDEYKSRIQARYNLRKQPHKYCISGIKNTPEGPVYIISGLRPPEQCECAQAIREKEESEAFEKQRAKMPNTGRFKYEISGVKAMPGENIYIMARALKTDPCECEKLLRIFEDAHKDCLDQFDKYMEQTEIETSAFTDEREEVRMEQEFEDYERRHSNEDIPEEDIESQQTQSDGDVDYKEINAEKKESPSKEDQEIDKETVEHKEDQTTSNSESDSSSSEDNDSESSYSDSSELGSCHVDNPPNVKQITLVRDKILPDSFLSKRFAIFRHLPTSKKDLIPILKHILEGMAEDGFPLAKLPEAYKLPIFNLWLELRLGTYWSYDNRLSYLSLSKYYWKHTDICFRRPPRTTMPFSRHKANTMTWKDAKYIKGLAERKTNQFYRKLIQDTVDTGREFFGTTFSYEFPTHTWRDCAFAYIPTKEEDIFPYRIVQPYDGRNVPLNKRLNCYC